MAGRISPTPGALRHRHLKIDGGFRYRLFLSPRTWG